MDLVVVVVTEANSTQIQHVNRKSSDELLRKFADPDDVDKSTKRRRKSAATTNSRENGVDVESNTSTTGLVERKRLLLAPAASKRRSLFLRQIASGKSHLKKKSLVRTIGKVHTQMISLHLYKAPPLLVSFLQIFKMFFACFAFRHGVKQWKELQEFSSRSIIIDTDVSSAMSFKCQLLQL